MAQNTILTQADGAVWVQPNGPGNALYYVGCIDVDDVVSPQGDGDLIFCRDATRRFITVAQKSAMPEKVTTTLTFLTGKTRNYLEKLKCSFSLYVLQNNGCGRLDQWGNADRLIGLHNVRSTSKTMSGLAHHQDSDESTRAMEVTAWPPVYEAVLLTTTRHATAETQQINSIFGTADLNCGGDCPDGSNDPGQYLVATPDSAVGPATANVLFSNDYGVTWASGAADPFAAGLHIAAGVRVILSDNTHRVWVSRTGGGAVQGLIAYSDDDGASWTSVNIGGAAAGHGAVYGPAMFAINSNLILLGSQGGYIYRNTGTPGTWTAVEQGVITVDPWNATFMLDSSYGMAVSDSGVTAKTVDGGATWAATGVVAAGVPDLKGVYMLSSRVAFCAGSNGILYKTVDAGATWTALSTIGTAVTSLRGIGPVMFAAENTGGQGTIYRSVNGGYYWEAIAVPAVGTLLDLFVVDENRVFGVGPAVGGTGLIVEAKD